MNMPLQPELQRNESQVEVGLDQVCIAKSFDEMPAASESTGSKTFNAPEATFTSITSPRELKVAVSIFPDRFAKKVTLREKTWGEIVTTLANPIERDSKEACPLLKLATFGAKRTPKGSLRSDDNMLEISGIEGDYDNEAVSIDDAAERLTAAGIESFLYSSASHRVVAPPRSNGGPRWRVLVPLSRRYPVSARKRLVSKLNAVLNGILARESFTDSQTYYFGRVKGVRYEHRHVEGAFLDEIADSLIETYPQDSSPPSTASEVSRESASDSLERETARHEVTDDVIANLRSALSTDPIPWIDPDDYTNWISVGEALKTLAHFGREEEGRELWYAWSRYSKKFLDGKKDPGATWAGFKADRTNYRSVFEKAMQGGWPNPWSVGFATGGLETTIQGSVAATLKSLILRPPPTIDELRSVKPVEMLVEGIIQHRLAGTLVAEGGTGKTTLLILLGISIATGRPWLGQRVTRQGSTVLLSLDDAQEDLNSVLAEIVAAERLTDAEVELVASRLRLVSLRGRIDALGFAHVSQSGFAQRSTLDRVLGDTLAEVPDLQLVVLDTLRQFSGGNSNDERTMTIATQSVTAIAERLGVTLMVPHHTGKTERSDKYAASGSSAIADNLRFVLLLQRSSLEEVAKAVSLSESESLDLQSADSVLRITSERGSLRMKKPSPIFCARFGYSVRQIKGSLRRAADRQVDAFREVAKAIDGGATSARRLREVLRGGEREMRTRIEQFEKLGLIGRNGLSKMLPLVVTKRGRALLDGSDGSDDFEDLM